MEAGSPPRPGVCEFQKQFDCLLMEAAEADRRQAGLADTLATLWRGVNLALR